MKRMKSANLLKTGYYSHFSTCFFAQDEIAKARIRAFPRRLRSLTDRGAACLFATSGYAMTILLARGGGFVRDSIGVVPDERVL